METELQKVKVIGLCGLEKSGKSTVAQIMVQKLGYVEVSFACVLKDIVAVAFDWPRDWMDGLTSETRIWRDQVDEWWAKKLNIKNLTPKWVLRNWGTDVIREHFHPNFWIVALERKFFYQGNNCELCPTNKKIVFSDCRFLNEHAFVKSMKGATFCISRNEIQKSPITLINHVSENEFKLFEGNIIKIENNGTLDELEKLILDAEKLSFLW